MPRPSTIYPSRLRPTGPDVETDQLGSGQLGAFFLGYDSRDVLGLTQTIIRLDLSGDVETVQPGTAINRGVLV